MRVPLGIKMTMWAPHFNLTDLVCLETTYQNVTNQSHKINVLVSGLWSLFFHTVNTSFVPRLPSVETPAVPFDVPHMHHLVRICQISIYNNVTWCSSWIEVNQQLISTVLIKLHFCCSVQKQNQLRFSRLQSSIAALTVTISDCCAPETHEPENVLPYYDNCEPSWPILAAAQQQNITASVIRGFRWLLLTPFPSFGKHNLKMQLI